MRCTKSRLALALYSPKQVPRYSMYMHPPRNRGLAGRKWAWGKAEASQAKRNGGVFGKKASKVPVGPWK